MQVDALRAARLVPSGSAGEWIDCGTDSDAMPCVRYAAVESGMCLRISQAWEAAIASRAPRALLTPAPYLNLLAMFGTARGARDRVLRAARPGAPSASDLGPGTHRHRARRRRLSRRHEARGARARVWRGVLLDDRRRSRARSPCGGRSSRRTRRRSKTTTSTRTSCRRRKRCGRCPTPRRSRNTGSRFGRTGLPMCDTCVGNRRMEKRC